MKNHLILFFILGFCIISGCALLKGKNRTSPDHTNNSEIQPQLIFLTFNIVRDSNKEHSEVSIEKVQLTDGELKKSSLDDPYKPSYANKLRCVYISEKNDTLLTTTIDHPLYKKFEYTNEDGSMGTKDVVLKESTFSLRTDYDKEMKYIIIFESIGNNNEAEIAKIEIPL